MFTLIENGEVYKIMLPLVTSNTASAPQLSIKGRLEVGKAADALVLTKEGFEIREVISCGRRLVKEGNLDFTEKFLHESNRRIVLEGRKAVHENSQFPGALAPEKARAAAVETLA